MSSKAMFIGIDGAIPKLIKLFSAEGVLPNMTALMEKGCFTDMMSQIPVATPINWASLSTGAVPGVHNVVGFWCHTKGDRLDHYTSENAFTNTFINAERIWESVERQGGRSVVMKFPGSWPPSVKNGVQIDGYCIPSHNGSVLDLACNGCFAVQKLFKAHQIVLAPAEGWKNVTDPCAAAAEIVIPLKKDCGSLRYQLLTVGAKGFERVLLCREKDTATAFAQLRAGEWSDWSRETITEELYGSVRFKLISLSPDGTDLRLYHSQIYPSRGFTYPDAMGTEIQEVCGPMIEFASPHAWKYGWTDMDTCFEEASYQVEWMIKAARHLLKDPWDLFVTQFHWVDHIQHYFLPWVDPVSPAYKPEKEAYARSVLRAGYQLADKLVGGLTARADGNTSVFVLSDHGNICDEYTVSLLPLFVKEGFITTYHDSEGKLQIDWSKTVAYPCKPGNGDIYINLKGRDAEGCVAPEDFEAVRGRVIDTLRSLKAPNGKNVYDLVLRSEDAVPLGIYGAYAPDIVTVYAQGMSWAGHGGEEWDREDTIFAVSTDEGMDYGAHHGPMGPCAETEVCCNKAFLIASGKGIRQGYDRTETALGPVRVLDVAPTMSHVMGLDAPAQNQGAVIGDFLCRDH